MINNIKKNKNGEWAIGGGRKKEGKRIKKKETLKKVHVLTLQDNYKVCVLQKCINKNFKI